MRSDFLSRVESLVTIIACKGKTGLQLNSKAMAVFVFIEKKYRGTVLLIKIRYSKNVKCDMFSIHNIYCENTIQSKLNRIYEQLQFYFFISPLCAGLLHIPSSSKITRGIFFIHGPFWFVFLSSTIEPVSHQMRGIRSSHTPQLKTFKI